MTPSNEVTESLSPEEERRVAAAIELSDEYAELRYLRFFFQEADFGPAHSDVVAFINEGYDKPLPEGYGEEE